MLLLNNLLHNNNILHNNNALHNNNKIKFRLFNCFNLISIKKKDDTVRIKFLAIPLIKIKHKNKYINVYLFNFIKIFVIKSKQE